MEAQSKYYFKEEFPLPPKKISQGQKKIQKENKQTNQGPEQFLYSGRLKYLGLFNLGSKSKEAVHMKEMYKIRVARVKTHFPSFFYKTRT